MLSGIFRWKEGAPMKLVNLLIYGVSFLCFLLCLILGDPLPAALGAIPFLVFLCTAVHEAGHCLGCLLTGSPIREVQLPLLSFGKNGLRLSQTLRPASYCSFRKNRAPWLVYLSGPVFSLIFLGLLLLGYRLHPSLILLFGSIVAALIVLVNVIPCGQNDMAQLMKLLRSSDKNIP